MTLLCCQMMNRPQAVHGKFGRVVFVICEWTDRQTGMLITVLQTGTSIYLVADVAQPGVTPDKKAG